MMHNGYYYGDGGVHPLMWVLMILCAVVFIGAIAWIVVALTRQRSASTQPPASMSGSSSARRILDDRLAKGEIDIDEYTRRRDLLSSG
jgi:putative membrane protein